MSSLVVEYSKTSRASCKGCQKVITEPNIRIGKVSKSFTYDGEMTFWYHPKCFDEAIEDVSSIKGFDDLYPEHQESLQKRFDGGAAPSSSAAADDDDDDKKEDEDIEGLKIEYAKSSRSSCVQCGDKIEKGALRLGNIEKSFRYAGLYSQWHHIECAFKQTKFPIPSHNDIHGFSDITAQDQKLVKELIKKHPTSASSSSSSASASSKKAATTTAAADGDHDDDGDVEGLKIEYAKSNRSGCAHCSEKIEKGTLRLGNLTKSYSYKGMFAHWYHIQCAFKQTKYPIASHTDLHGFNEIQANDQKLVKDLIKKNPPSAAMDEHATGGKGKGKKGEKRSREDDGDEDGGKKSKSNPVTGAIKGIFNRIAKTFTK